MPRGTNFFCMWRSLLQVDLVFKEASADYKNGNTLVVKTSLIEMESVNFLKVVNLW